IYMMLLFLLPFLAGCEDENKAVLDLNQSTPTAITSPASGAAFELLAENADEMVVLDFEAAVFQLDVATAYTLEMSATEDFSEPVLLESTISAKDGKVSFSVVTWNKALLAQEYEPMVEAPVYFRLVTRIIDSELRTYSNVLDVKVKPYKIASDGSTDDGSRIYIVGAAVPAGWNPGDAVEMVNIAPDTYRATTTFSVERFRFLAQQDWGDGYTFPYFETLPEDLLENARQPDREDDEENLWFKGEPGDYVVTVNLATKTLTMTPAPSDGTVDDGTRIYMVGAAVPDAGWEPGDAIEMLNIAPNVYRATATLANERFRFLGQKDWNPVVYNWSFFTGYVSGMLESALQPDREDGDGNIWFKGVPGSYVITVDLDKKTILIDPPFSDDGTKLYMVGAGVPDAGWEPGDAIEMNNIAPNVYRATATFANDRFRFLGQKAWDPVSYKWPYFTGEVSSMLESALQPDREDGDGNIWFTGTPGAYTITVDLTAKGITIY
ncbi:MAG: SusF/SusE family outer membrane protein, partial [Bacteroidales bacterium]|nr:SusF/SusE family outer membrane protein [Bacteroidales bacterium]